MFRWILILSILIGGCREFYDEEFEDGQFQSSRQNVSYSSSLSSTDPNFTALSGTSTVDVQNENVTVSLDLSGVPENIAQIHYGYISADCSSLNISFAGNSSTTRSFTISENSSLSALQTDISSSGASGFAGDTNLENKSFIVKAFSTFSGLPNATGTNSLIIACGPIEVVRSDDSDFLGVPSDVDGSATTLEPDTTDVLSTPDSLNTLPEAETDVLSSPDDTGVLTTPESFDFL